IRLVPFAVTAWVRSKAGNYQCLREIGDNATEGPGFLKGTFGDHNNHESCELSFTALPELHSFLPWGKFRHSCLARRHRCLTASRPRLSASHSRLAASP